MIKLMRLDTKLISIRLPLALMKWATIFTKYWH